MTTPISWVVVADGRDGRILRTLDGHHLEAALDHDFVGPNPLDHETGPERPGRVQNSLGGGRHALEGFDHHRAHKEEFLARIAHELDGAALAGRFERLYLIAPPQALGDLRAHLGQHAAGRIAGELALDLTHEPTHELEKRLETLLA